MAGSEEIARLLVVLEADIKDLKAKMGAGKAVTQSFAQKAGKGLKALRANWLAVTAATAGTIIAVRRAWKGFADFEHKMREVNTLMRLSEKEFQGMTAAVREMTRRVPQSGKELANALYDITSAGVAAGDALRVLELSARAAVAGVTDTQTAARVGVSIVNAYGMEISELGNVYDILFRTVEEGVITFSEISASFGQILPSARGAGVSIQEVGAAMAALTKAGVPVSVAATSLRAGITKLKVPTDEVKKKMADLGIVWDGLYGTIRQLSEKGITDLDEMKGLIPDERASKGILSLAQNFDLLTEAMEAVGESRGAMQAAFEEMMKSPVNRMRLLGNSLAIIRDNMTKAFAPQILKTVEDLYEALGYLTAETTNAAGETMDLTTEFFGLGLIIQGTIGIIRGAVNQFAIFATGIMAVGFSIGAAMDAIAGNLKDAKMGWKIAWDALTIAVKDANEDITGDLESILTKIARFRSKVGKGAGAQFVSELVTRTTEEGPKGPPKGPPGAPTDISGIIGAQLALVKAELATALAEIEGMYAESVISTEEYYEKKRANAVASSEAEMQALQKLMAVETDEQKLRILGIQYMTIQQQQKTTLIGLHRQEADELGRLAEKNAELIAKIQERITASSTGGMLARFEEEARLLDKKHEDELKKLEEQKAKEDEILEAHRLHNIEQDQLAAQQKQELQQATIDGAIASAGVLYDIYSEYYELVKQQERQKITAEMKNMKLRGASEKQMEAKKAAMTKAADARAKKAWEKQKKAAMAMAIINAAQAIIKGFADYGPIAGLVFAVLTGILTGIQIAKISQQTYPGLAEGGLIKRGTGPRADDVHIRASKGEYVSPADSVQHYGTGVYEAMRRRAIPRSLFGGIPTASARASSSGRYAEGGLVAGPAGKEKPEFTIVNFLDEGLMEKFLATSAGQAAIVNVMEERSEEVRRVLEV